MSPLGVLDPLDGDLTRRRMISAAAARCWAVGPAARDDRHCVGYPRTVEHAGGRSVLARRPVRVFAARTLMELDTLLALGVVPAGVGSRGGVQGANWRAIAAEADIPVVDVGRPDSAARLAHLRIDLVVASTVLREVPAELADYARMGVPVLLLPADDVGEQLRIVGAALDLDGRAARLAEQARPAPGGGGRWRPRTVAAFTRDGDGTAHLLTGASPLGAMLRAYGLPEPTGPSDVQTAPARLTDLDAELIIGLELSAGQLGGVESDPRFAALPAVRAGGYRRLDPVASYALCVPSVLTAPVAAQVMESVLADR